MGIYYIDNKDNTYVIGDVGGDLKSRCDLIENAKITESYKSRGRTWFYLRTERGYDACVLFADMVYIDESYQKNIIGQILVYVDADNINIGTPLFHSKYSVPQKTDCWKGTTILYRENCRQILLVCYNVKI